MGRGYSPFQPTAQLTLSRGTMAGVYTIATCETMRAVANGQNVRYSICIAFPNCICCTSQFQALPKGISALSKKFHGIARPLFTHVCGMCLGCVWEVCGQWATVCPSARDVLSTVSLPRPPLFRPIEALSLVPRTPLQKRTMELEEGEEPESHQPFT